MNSLPEIATTTDFIRISLEVLRAECPQAYQVMCSLMAGKNLLLHIGDEPVWLTFQQEGIALLPPSGNGHSGTRLHTDWQTILALADAQLTLTEAVLEGRLDLFGKPGELALLHEAILTYLRGAVRCPSFPALLDQARQVHGEGLAKR